MLKEVTNIIIHSLLTTSERIKKFNHISVINLRKLLVGSHDIFSTGKGKENKVL